MGVIIGKVFPKEKEPEAPEFLAPTPAQMQIIKETWEIPKANLTDSGEMILFRFLDDFPKNQDQFEAFSNVPLLSLKGTPGFRTHATRIMGIFQGAVDCLDSEDVIGSLHKNFSQMSMNHARRHIPKASYLEMRGVVLEVLTEACNLNEEQQEAWRVFFNCAVNIIFGKYEEYYALNPPKH